MDAPAPFGRRLARAFKNLVVTTLVLGSVGAAAYAASLLNARTWTLEVRQGRLVVLKGRMLPFGAEPWTPADPRLVDAYAPIELEGNTALSVAGQRFGDRDELDRALFQVLELLAKPRIGSDAPKDLERGLALLRRAEQLSGLTGAQRESLKAMRAGMAFYIARQHLDDARRGLEEALAQLKLAAESDAKHRAQANLMVLAVEPQVQLLASTLRATTLTHDAIGTLGRALEPQLQSIFEALQQKLKPAEPTLPAAAPPPATTEGEPAPSQPAVPGP